MLDIEALKVSYRRGLELTEVLGPISFKVEEGKNTVIIGPSGCGKSTLLKILAGINKQYTGRILIEGCLLGEQDNVVGYIPQGYGLLPWKTVYQNCVLPYKVNKEKLDEDKLAYIDELLKNLEIGELRRRYPSMLSGGQRQRVAIARAFATKPKLLLMDEPFSALDAIMREEAGELFLKMQKQYGCTSVMVTHNIDEALYMGNQIIILSNTPGQIVNIIDNPLFGNKEFREDDRFKIYYHQIKEYVKKGWQS